MINTVTFDVSGKLLDIEEQHVLKWPDTIFAKMLKPEFDRRSSKSDPIVIKDKDPQIYKVIFDFMVNPNDFDVNEENAAYVHQEADYAGLVDLASYCEMYQFYINYKQCKIFSDWEKLREFMRKNIDTTSQCVLGRIPTQYLDVVEKRLDDYNDATYCIYLNSRDQTKPLCSIYDPFEDCHYKPLNESDLDNDKKVRVLLDFHICGTAVRLYDTNATR